MTADAETAAPGNPFVRFEKIRFQHCDPAGIVFYPRYAEMINATVEDWFEKSVGISFAEIHVARNVAIPVASLSISFKSPARLGDDLRFELVLARMGRSSAAIEISAFNGAAEVLKANLTLVFISKEDYRPREWPAEFRQAMPGSFSIPK